MKTKDEILEIARQIGLSKGYRINQPEDWYNGITRIEFENKKCHKGCYEKYFKKPKYIIKALFPFYDFLELKFKCVFSNFWRDKNNVIISNKKAYLYCTITCQKFRRFLCVVKVKTHCDKSQVSLLPRH